MVGGWVLFHYRRGDYLYMRPQAEHTLSTWTIHCLVRERHFRPRGVRPRPEFWRPEQRRPRSVLCVPIGDGVACLARRRKFTRREIRAVRAVLRFFETRKADPSSRTALEAVRRRPAEMPALAGEGLIGRSRPWRRVIDQVMRVARSRCAVVLRGETGTGKERIAHALHAASGRAQGPFVPLNCGAVAPDVLASELFGHVRGAFTGADRNRMGVIVRAHRGTLFLDEVADMSPAMQVALLRVIEEKRVTPVGGTRTREVDVRIVSASHQDLADEVAAGRFREDLFHRLSVVTIFLPPLRERGGDLALLSAYLLEKLDPPRILEPDTLAALSTYSWPGNVRELDSVLRAAALLSDGPSVPPDVVENAIAQRARLTRKALGRRLEPAARGPRSERLLTLLEKRWLAAPALARELGVSPRTVNRELGRLVDHRLVEAHGEARARVYRRRTGV